MRTLFFILGLLLAANEIVSQTNYYTESKIFQEEGYTYKVDFSTFVKLYNADNKWIEQQPRYKDTGEIFEEENIRIELSTGYTWNRAESLCDSIMRAEFSAADMECISKDDDNTIFVHLYINSETGFVEEVSFSFYNKSPYAYIPVSTYRRIELAIKEEVRIAVIEDESLLTFIYYWMYFDFK